MRLHSDKCHALIQFSDCTPIMRQHLSVSTTETRLPLHSKCCPPGRQWQQLLSPFLSTARGQTHNPRCARPAPFQLAELHSPALECSYCKTSQKGKGRAPPVSTEYSEVTRAGNKHRLDTEPKWAHGHANGRIFCWWCIWRWKGLKLIEEKGNTLVTHI